MATLLTWAPRKTNVELIAAADLPTDHGEFRILGFRADDGEEIVALVLGYVSDGDPVLVRIHSQCLTGDVFGSVRCDCGRQLDAALAEIAREGRGIVIYQPQEGRGIGILNKIRAYALQDCGRDTVDANVELGFAPDERTYESCVAVLERLGIRRVRVISNNPDKILALEAAGLDVVECVRMRIDYDAHMARYLNTKIERMGHQIDMEKVEGT